MRTASTTTRRSRGRRWPKGTSSTIRCCRTTHGTASRSCSSRALARSCFERRGSTVLHNCPSATTSTRTRRTSSTKSGDLRRSTTTTSPKTNSVGSSCSNPHTVGHSFGRSFVRSSTTVGRSLPATGCSWTATGCSSTAIDRSRSLAVDRSLQVGRSLEAGYSFAVGCSWCLRSSALRQSASSSSQSPCSTMGLSRPRPPCSGSSEMRHRHTAVGTEPRTPALPSGDRQIANPARRNPRTYPCWGVAWVALAYATTAAPSA